ncbi:DNA polymerase III subunit psi, partial [Serratia marcescens]
MASKRDWLLQQLGITQWTLRRPGVLQGEVAVSLPPEARLLVVAQTLPAPD